MSFSLRPQIHRDENLLGYVLRLSGENGFVSPVHLLRAMVRSQKERASGSWLHEKFLANVTELARVSEKSVD